MQANKKQISLIVITLFAFAIFLWQLIALFHSDISAKTNTPFVAEPLKMTPPVATKQNLKTSPAPILTHTQSSQQKAYLDLLNRYQLAKMQHKLLQEELAIANARQKIAELDQKNTTDTSLEARNVTTGFGTEITKTESKTQNNTPFKLVYLGFQNGHWSATINKKGRYQQLNKGMTLADGTNILNVDKEGIEFQNDQQRYRLTFTELTLLSPPTQTNIAITDKEPTVTPRDEKTPSSKIKMTTHKITPPHEKISAALVMTQKTSPNKPHTLDETVLLEMPPSSYTIKLMVGDKNHLLDFARKHHIADRTLCYSHANATDDQSTLVYGDYLTTRAALSALNNLPPQLRQHPLCIQRLELIQHEITG